MKLVSWNVNSLRACVKKGFLDYINEVDADIFCIQEAKLQEGKLIYAWMDFISIGIMLKRKGISALP